MSPALGNMVTQAGSAAGRGAGTLAAVALIHRIGASALVMEAFTVFVVLQASESAGRTLPGIITAIGNLLTARIRARADAQATIITATARAELARSGLDPNRTAQAADMQRSLSANPDLPKDRRPTDDTLVKLQAGNRARSISNEPGTGPYTPGNGPRGPKPARSKVVSIHSDS